MAEKYGILNLFEKTFETSKPCTTNGEEVRKLKHIKTLNSRNLKESVKHGGCGECQTSCQSACKTSCTVGNQSCEKARQTK